MNPDPQSLEWNSPEWRGQRDLKLKEWFRGNEPALQTALLLSGISEVWDDLVDGDVKATTERINGAFVAALVRLRTNSFYVHNEVTLFPTIIAGINAWMDANELQGGTREDRAQAFYIRNYAYELVSIIVFCIGGWDYLRSVSLEMRRFFTHESYFTWEHRHAADKPV